MLCSDHLPGILPTRIKPSDTSVRLTYPHLHPNPHPLPQQTSPIAALQHLGWDNADLSAWVIRLHRIRIANSR